MYISVTLSNISNFFGNRVTNENMHYNFYEYCSLAAQKDFKWCTITRRKLMTEVVTCAGVHRQMKEKQDTSNIKRGNVNLMLFSEWYSLNSLN